MKTHTCPSCANTTNAPELNDDPSVNPKIKLDEMVRIEFHGSAIYRVMKIQGVVLELEKI